MLLVSNAVLWSRDSKRKPVECHPELPEVGFGATAMCYWCMHSATQARNVPTHECLGKIGCSREPEKSRFALAL
jgi:hypothetical protein